MSGDFTDYTHKSSIHVTSDGDTGLIWRLTQDVPFGYEFIVNLGRHILIDVVVS